MDSFEVDLRDQRTLGEALRNFLRLGVCRVDHPGCPGLLKVVEVRLLLPDGSSEVRSGQVIYQLNPSSFLVQLAEPLSVETLARLGEYATMSRPAVPPPTSKATSPPVARVSHTPPFGTQAVRTKEAAPASQPKVSVDNLLEGLPVELAELGTEPKTEQSGTGPSHVTPAPPPEPASEIGPSPLVTNVAQSEEATPRGKQEPGTPLTGKESEESDAYAHVRDLPLHEKHKLARHGSRTLRQLLVRDQLKAVHVSVFQNPDITLDEVVEYSALPGLSREAIELIVQNRTWIASRQVILNLVRNPATPADIAGRLLPRLGPNEWRAIVRSGLARPNVVALARKLLMETEE